jgi:hypothetical protein
MYPAKVKMTDNKFAFIMLGMQVPTMDDLASYITVDQFKADVGDDTKAYLESLFRKYNSDENPLSCEEKKKLIRENNSYTSMSVGSVVKINDEYWVVKGFGWGKI